MALTIVTMCLSVFALVVSIVAVVWTRRERMRAEDALRRIKQLRLDTGL